MTRTKSGNASEKVNKISPHTQKKRIKIVQCYYIRQIFSNVFFKSTLNLQHCNDLKRRSNIMKTTSLKMTESKIFAISLNPLPWLVEHINIPTITCTSSLTPEHVEIMTFMISRMKTFVTEWHARRDSTGPAAISHKVLCPHQATCHCIVVLLDCKKKNE